MSYKGKKLMQTADASDKGNMLVGMCQLNTLLLTIYFDILLLFFSKASLKGF